MLWAPTLIVKTARDEGVRGCRVAQPLRRSVLGRRCPLPSPLLTKPSALIVARDPMTGALIGSLVEVSGFRPLFPTTSETARHAIARVRPEVVLVDWDASDQDDWVGSVAEHGGAVVLFSPWRSAPDLREIAAGLGVAYFTLPIHWVEFRRLLELAVGKSDD